MKRTILVQSKQLNNIPYNTKDDTIIVGDLVVVIIAGEFVVLPVIQVTGVTQITDRWVVQKIHMDQYEARIALEDKKRKVQEQIKDFEAKIPQKERLKELAANRPKLKKLLAELEAIEPGD